MEKTLNMGTYPGITTVIKKTIVRNIEEDPKQMASMGVATATANAHNISRLIETIDQYKGKMEEMK